MTARSWKEKWASISSKFATATEECVTAYRSDEKCRDSIEGVVAEIWNLKDWIANDPAALTSRKEIDAFLGTPEALHIRACGDMETVQKHYRADDPRRESTELTWVGDHSHPSGFPVVFSVTRIYKDGSGSDHWEDAYELATRAMGQWMTFLASRGLSS